MKCHHDFPAEIIEGGEPTCGKKNWIRNLKLTVSTIRLVGHIHLLMCGAVTATIPSLHIQWLPAHYQFFHKHRSTVCRNTLL